MVDRQTDFANRFNEILGNKVGKPLTTQKANITAKNNISGFNLRSVDKHISDSAKKANQANKSSSTKSKTSVVDELAKQQYLKERAAELQKEAEDQPWYKDVLGTVLHGLDALDTPRAFVTSGVKELTDSIYGSRVGEWLDNAMGTSKEERQANLDRMGTGSWKDFVDQGWSNIGFGDVWQDVGSPDHTKNKWVNRAVGFAGDIAMDPFTYVGVKAATGAASGLAKSIGVQYSDDAVRRAASAVDKANKLQTAAGKAKAASQAVARKKADDALAEAERLMQPVRAKYKVQVPTNEFTTDYVRMGPQGQDAFKASLNVALDDAGRPWAGILDNPLDREAASTVQRVRLIEDVEKGALQPQDFIDEYRKITPRSKVLGMLDQGAINLDEAVSRISAFKPQITPEVEKLAKAPLASIQEVAQEQLDKVAYDILGGGLKGKTIGTPREIIPAMANKVTEEFKSIRLYEVNKQISQFRRHADDLLAGGKGKLTAKQIATLRQNQEFETWFKGYIGKISKNGANDPVVVKRAMAAGDEALARRIEDELMSFHAKLMDSLEGSINRTPIIKMFGKDVMPLPRLGTVGRKAGDAWNATKFGESFNKAFKYSSNFPGYTTLLGNKSKSLGIREYETFKTAVAAKVKELAITPVEAKQLQRNLENGVRGSGRMADAYDWIRLQYDEMYHGEIKSGIREVSRSKRVDNYAYAHIYSKHSKAKINEVMAQRSSSAQKLGKLDGFTSNELRSMGHKVESDAFMNLLYRKMKSQRQMTRAYFYRDLAMHYGIKGTNITPEEAQRRGIREIMDNKKDFIATEMKTTLKDGESIYMDSAMHDVYKKFENLQHNADEVIRTLDYVTRKFKTWNTIYFPGYHVRNMIGDIFMGTLDGVKTSDYATVMKNWFKRSTSTINVGGQTTQYDRLFEAFERNLSSGTYVDAELSKGLNRVATIPGTVRKLSEGREDFGRFVHFYRAMDDEYGALLKKGVSKDKAWDEAIVKSMARVNQFKFDYAALTASEMKYMRRGIPFYTYARKAVPTLLESLMMQPKYLVTLNRWQNQLESRYDTAQLPDWMRELGYMKMTDGFGMANDLLPTATLEGALENPASKVNPLAQIPFELATGTDLFSGKPVDGWKDVLMNKWRGFNLYNPTENEGMLERTDKPVVEKVARLAGIPLAKIDDVESQQALTEARAKIQDKIEAWNSKMDKKGYAVYLSDRNDGMSIRIKDKTTGAVIWEGETLAEAKKAVEDL